MPINPLEVTGGLAIGEGVGGAIADVVTPRLQNFKNDQWSKHKDKPLDAKTAAEVAAEEVDLYATMETQASFSGYDEARFADLYRVTLTAPGVGTLIELLRRNGEVPIDFAHGLRKAKLGNQWDKALRNLRDVRIPGPDLAYMVVRGVVPNDGTLPSALPTQADRLDLPPQLAIDTLTEAAKTGWDPERFAALVARSGLAMAPIMAAQANFRGILTDNDYLLTIARGDLFPAYADPVREVARQIPTAHDGIEDHLRGWVNAAGMYATTARHGMSQADTDLLFRITGRPLSFHQVFIGERRGGVYDGPTAAIDPHFLKSLQESNIRPEWYNLAWAQRYSYPSAFVLRALLQGGVITATQGEGYFLDIGWPPALAKQVAEHYGSGTTAKADPHIGKAQTQLWTTLHRSYLAGESTAGEVSAALPRAGVAAASVADVLATWDEERTIIRKQLSPAQVKKAYVEGVLNPDTGSPWTKDEATAALVARGYSTADATTFLEL